MSTRLDALHALAVLQLPGVGAVTARKILARCSDGDFLSVVRTCAPNFSDRQWSEALRDAERIIDDGEVIGIEAIAITSGRYPARLRRIPDPPVVLYVRGDSSALSGECIAVVGTRDVSAAGARLTRLVAGCVGQHGFTVVSGLALGVDALAHEAALESKAITVAIMAHGLDIVAPTSNRKLAERILDAGGALVSEHHHGVPPRPAEFVRRNRIQSGISLGSVIIESGIAGGSMHQARFTKTQGRHLMTVLASSDASRGDLREDGANELISTLGATPLRSLGDLKRELAHIRAITEPENASGELF